MQWPYVQWYEESPYHILELDSSCINLFGRIVILSYAQVLFVYFYSECHHKLKRHKHGVNVLHGALTFTLWTCLLPHCTIPWLTLISHTQFPSYMSKKYDLNFNDHTLWFEVFFISNLHSNHLQLMKFNLVPKRGNTPTQSISQILKTLFSHFLEVMQFEATVL
jgi:hypothetical protein